MKNLLVSILVGLALCAVAREKVIFDTDIGGDVDDALALAYLVAEPECELMGVTIAGWNGSAPKQAEIASALIKSYGRDVPVKIGPGITLTGGKKFSPNPKRPPRYWPAVKDLPRDRFTLSNDAVDFMNRTIRANPGEITLVAVGHLTNLGVLFTAYPDVVAKLKKLVVMGGNLKGGVEWNALQDPVATATAFGNGNGSFPPVTMIVGSEVTGPKHIPPAEARAWMTGVSAMEILAQMAEYWYKEGHDLYFHDPAAAMTVFHPEICTWTNGTVTVDAKTSCMTVDKMPNPERATLTYATSFDIAKFRRIYRETLAKPMMTVSFTFDDGLKCHLDDVAPALEKFGFRGTFNIVTDWVGKDKHLTWEDIRELRKRGHETVPHGAAHLNLRNLVLSNRVEEARREIVRAREAFERNLGLRPTNFCLPYNACNAQVAELLRAEGMEPMTTLRPSADVAALDRCRTLGWRHVDLISHGGPKERWEPLFKAAADRRSWLKVVTYGTAHPVGTRCPSPMHGVLCLTYDDSCFDDWRRTRPLFRKYGASATYYALGKIDGAFIDEMRYLRGEGCTVGLHTVFHSSPPANEDVKGTENWIRWSGTLDQLATLKAAKLPVWSFAYPNNRRTEESDRQLRALGFRSFRAGAKFKYAFKGDVTAETAQRFDTVDDAFMPVEWAFWDVKCVYRSLGMGPVYCYSKENVFGALRRAAERNEILSFFSHSIRDGEPDWIGTKTAWLEDILAEAKRLGVEVRGFDQIGQQ